MPVHLLQPWTTVQATASFTSFTQSAEDWLDLSAFGEAAFLIDVTQVSGSEGSTIQMLLQSSPTLDESYFGPVCPAVTLAPVSTPIQVKSVRSASTFPLTRFLRWQLVALNNSSTWGATFRVRVIPSKQSFFVPTDLGGCALWLRADLGTTLVASGGNQFVQQWNDQSASGDANKNLSQATLANQPQFNAANAGFNLAPTLTLSSASSTTMSSGTWAVELVQPSTWIVASSNRNLTTTRTLITGNTFSVLQGVDYDPSIPAVNLRVPSTSLEDDLSWTGSAALLGEWNGASSQCFFNNFSSSSAGADLTDASGNQNSMTLGSYPSGAGGANWDGDVAEIIAYNRVLLRSEKMRLRSYLNGRYALGIT
jgi:hypothetical protein